MFRSLQARLTAGVVAVVAVAIVAVGVSTAVLYSNALYGQYQATYASEAEAASLAVDNRLRTTLVDQVLRNESPNLRDGDLGTVVAELSRQLHFRVSVYSIIDHKVIAEATDTGGRADAHLAPDNLGTIQHSTLLQLKLQGVRPAAPQPTATIAAITISDPMTDRAYQQQQFVQRTAWITLGALALALVLGGVLAERLTAPFRVLARAASRIGEGNLAERVPEGPAREGRRDEAAELAHQFNRMAGRLEESFALMAAERDRLALDRDHLRLFVADVSHELRTPLTALHTFNDLLHDGAGENADTRREFLDASAQQIERLEWLTRNLLDLSRLEAGITRIEARSADLGETLRRAVATNRPAAAARGIALALDAPPLVAMHDPHRLEQALGNILNNAIKFSPPGGTVSAALRDTGSGVIVEVRDRGAGIPSDEVTHVFERFYRGRDANRGGEGSGLGLAITKAIVDAHGGAVVLESAPGAGTTVRITLPQQSFIARS